MEIVYRAAAAEQVHLIWREKPRRVLLLTKPLSWAPELLTELVAAAAALSREHGVTVCLEPDVHAALYTFVDSERRAKLRGRRRRGDESDSRTTRLNGDAGSDDDHDDDDDDENSLARAELLHLPRKSDLEVWGRRLPAGVTPAPTAPPKGSSRSRSPPPGSPPPRASSSSSSSASSSSSSSVSPAALAETRTRSPPPPLGASSSTPLPTKPSAVAEASTSGPSAVSGGAVSSGGGGSGGSEAARPVDLVVTLGGDGLLMHANTLFPGAAPPILSLSGGSLGFLAPFDMSEVRSALRLALTAPFDPTPPACVEKRFEDVVVPGASSEGIERVKEEEDEGYDDHDDDQTKGTDADATNYTPGMQLSLRMRLSCSFIPDKPVLLSPSLASSSPSPSSPPSPASVTSSATRRRRRRRRLGEEEQPEEEEEEELRGYSENASGGGEEEEEEERAEWRKQEEEEGEFSEPTTWTVLNEVVVERGPSPYLAALEVYVNGAYLTTMQADGVILSTPTGSTAYSMSAGGSMVHPSVPCVLLTPICPHSLSCRPMILPDSAEVVCRNCPSARADAWVSFDGKHRRRLRRGQALRITMSNNPLPTVNKVDDTADWFHGIASAFHFNERPMQRPLTTKNANEPPRPK